MNEKRLQRAAEVLRELKARGVVEGQNPWPTKPEGDSFNIDAWGHKTSCGTVACIGGWLTMDPELRAEGLVNAGELDGNGSTLPICGSESGTIALQYFLGITYAAAVHIFGAQNPNSIDAGIERIQEVIERGGCARGERP